MAPVRFSESIFCRHPFRPGQQGGRTSIFQHFPGCIVQYHLAPGELVAGRQLDAGYFAFLEAHAIGAAAAVFARLDRDGYNHAGNTAGEQEQGFHLEPRPSEYFNQPITNGHEAQKPVSTQLDRDRHMVGRFFP